MKIAVTYENGEIFQHFGQTKKFKIYEIETNRISSVEVISTMGNGHGALAGYLKEQKVDTLICGGIGGGAKLALEEAGIALYGGVSGEADTAVEAFLSNELKYNVDVECSHHEEKGEHSCGDH